MATTVSRIMKKAASSVIPLANRRTPQRNYTSGNNTNLFRQVTSIRPHHHRFSALTAEKKSNSDDTFLRLIESEIDSAEKVDEFLRDFPFKIVENAGEEFITLTREYQGQEIKVAVKKQRKWPRPSGDYSYEDHDQEEHVYSLDVSFSKEGGQTLKFHITSESANGITIQSLAIKNPNDSDNDHFPALERPAAFQGLSKSLQKALRIFLKVRGIEPRICKFLDKYDSMVQKRRSQQHTGWLKNLKSFIDK